MHIFDFGRLLRSEQEGHSPDFYCPSVLVYKIIHEREIMAGEESWVIGSGEADTAGIYSHIRVKAIDGII